MKHLIQLVETGNQTNDAVNPSLEYGEVIDLHPVYTAMSQEREAAEANGTEPAGVVWDPAWPDLPVDNDEYWNDLVDRNWETLSRWHAMSLAAGERKVLHIKVRDGVETVTVINVAPTGTASEMMPEPMLAIIPPRDGTGQEQAVGPATVPTRFAIATPQQLAELRLKLHTNGYHPVPIVGAHINTNSAGKRPNMTAWQTKCLNADQQEIAGWSTLRDQRECTNTGILCGEIVGVDIDVLDPALSAKLVARALELFGPSPLCRIGRAPKTLLVCRVETPHKKLTTPDLIFGNDVDNKDAHAKVEILADGQQFVAFGIHPDTRAYYHWPDKSPLDVPASDVPCVTPDTLRRFIDEAEQVLRAAGGRTKKEIEAPAAAPSISERATALVRPPGGALTGAFADSNGESFWKSVNALAMVNLSRWVPALFPTAKLQPGTGAWRVSSKDLGRDLQEDLSISPKGITDWGLSDQGDPRDGKRTPISLVIEHSPQHATAPKAALWLCELMGVRPKSLGWRSGERESGSAGSCKTGNGFDINDAGRQNDGSSHDEEPGGEAEGERPANEVIPSAKLPVIEITRGQLSSLATKGEERLIAAGVPLYQRGGILVRPVIETVDATRGRKTKVAQLKVLDHVYTRDLLGRHAVWMKWDARSGWVRVNPPMEIATTILARVGDWAFPAIRGVISTPTMRPDGSLLTEQGYDEVTGLLLVEPPPMPPIPDQPTREEALEALALLEGLLTGFPFVDDVAKACALSAIITPVVRGAFPVTPLHASRAPTAGSGKSFLWDIVAAIAIGQPMPVMSTGANTEETEKRLGAAMLAGQPLISIDNISGELGGDSLCQIIERPIVEIRILGRSERVRIEARGTSLFATGNNFVILGDVCRRVVITNLDPAMERPELRQFKFDPVEMVLANRGKYIAAALTICRAYFIAGRPNKANKLASFEGWSDTVRSALIWVGKEDPVKSMESARAEDPERVELSNLLEAWAAVIGIGSGSRLKLSAVLSKALNMTKEHFDAPLEPTYPEFHAALLAIAFKSTGKRGQQPDATTLGNYLRRFKNRVIDGKRFMNLPNEKHGGEWWVEDVGGSPALEKEAARAEGPALLDQMEAEMPEGPALWLAQAKAELRDRPNLIEEEYAKMRERRRLEDIAAYERRMRLIADREAARARQGGTKPPLE